MYFYKFIILITLFECLTCRLYSQEIKDSLKNKHSIKLDVISLYNVLFDTRVQLRMGCEYEQIIKKKSSLSCHIDFGLYDKYKFIKYYDFFNEHQGMYFIQQDIKISGIHLTPGYNYNFINFGKQKDIQCIVGTLVNFGYYHKEFDYFNSKTKDNYSNHYNQKKLGIGLSLGLKNYYGSHFFLEFKTSLLTKIFNSISIPNNNPIKSMDAQWISPDYRFWWISNFNIGYAF